MTDAELEEFNRALTLPFAEGQLLIRKYVRADASLVQRDDVREWAIANFSNMIAYMQTPEYAAEVKPIKQARMDALGVKYRRKKHD